MKSSESTHYLKECIHFKGTSKLRPNFAHTLGLTEKTVSWATKMAQEKKELTAKRQI